MAANILKLVGQRYFVVINLVLLTAFIGISVGTMYNGLTLTLDRYIVVPSDKPQHRKTSLQKQRKKSLRSYAVVSKRNLFKTAALSDLKKKDEVPDVNEMDVTDLKLKLLGTIVAGDVFSRAIIEEKKNKDQKLYKIGDAIQTATIKHILRNKVVLSVNGKDEVLEVEHKSGGRSSSSKKRSSDSSLSDSEGKTKNITVKRSLIEESMQNLNQLMKDVRIRPHFRNGESDGLIVSGIRGGSVFRKLGLRNGDIIMGVDGSQIESVDDAMKLYSGLSDLENMKVDIKRRGKMQTLNFKIE